jgi:hypothetical protein
MFANVVSPCGCSSLSPASPLVEALSLAETPFRYKLAAARVEHAEDPPRAAVEVCSVYVIVSTEAGTYSVCMTLHEQH